MALQHLGDDIDLQSQEVEGDLLKPMTIILGKLQQFA